MSLRWKWIGSILGAICVHLSFGVVRVQAQPRLVPIERGGKFGFADATGRVVIAPQFTAAKPFAMGLAPVRVGDCWRYINASGNVVIAGCFADAGLFSGGMAAVRSDGRWGYIDRTGALRIPFRYEFARAFGSGFAPVRRDTKWYYVNVNGAEVLAPAGGYDDAREFSEDLAAVRLNRRWGYIDRTGSMVIPTSFSDAKAFSRGLAPAQPMGDGRYGFINRTGAFAITPQFNWAEPFSDDLAAVRVEDLWGYIDPTGRQVLAPQFIHAESFQYGLARVVSPSNYRMYVNDRGQLVIPYSDSRATGLGAGGLVNLRITSAPTGAAVYLFPKRTWDADAGLRNDRQRWMVFRVQEGDTDTTARVFEKVYIAVFENCGTTERRRVDVLPQGPNSVHVSFSACPRRPSSP